MAPPRLKRKGYTKRWIVESFMSGLKRTTASMLNARQPATLFDEAGLRPPALKAPTNQSFVFNKATIFERIPSILQR
jgi:hypothetical protein